LLLLGSRGGAKMPVRLNQVKGLSKIRGLMSAFQSVWIAAGYETSPAYFFPNRYGGGRGKFVTLLNLSGPSFLMWECLGLNSLVECSILHRQPFAIGSMLGGP
jgi:hypothetical protein